MLNSISSCFSWNYRQVSPHPLTRSLKALSLIHTHPPTHLVEVADYRISGKKILLLSKEPTIPYKNLCPQSPTGMLFWFELKFKQAGLERDLAQSLFYEWESRSEEPLSPPKIKELLPTAWRAATVFLPHTRVGTLPHQLLPSSVGGQSVFSLCYLRGNLIFCLFLSYCCVTVQMDLKWTSKRSHITGSSSFSCLSHTAWGTVGFALKFMFISNYGYN